MQLIINVDKNSNKYLYKMIADQIAEAVKNGTLKPGEKLPTERELSETLNIARGTINKAYAELENNHVIDIVQGSGSFVSKDKAMNSEDRKKIAVEYIDKILTRLESMNFSQGEIVALFNNVISSKENKLKKINIAAIDCNPESLATFKEQFSSFDNIAVEMFLLDEVIKYSNPEKVFEDYDIIVTTVSHYEQVVSRIHSLRDRLFKIVLSPTQETIIKITNASKGYKIGVIARSNNFKRLILNRMESMSIDMTKVGFAFEDDEAKVDKLLLEMDVLIVPHFLLLNNQKLTKQLHYFRARERTVIDFQYQIERGSLIYIEERIHKLHSELVNRKPK